MSWSNVFAFSHRRAERLVDARLDAERGEADLTPKEAQWLERHLSSCESCRAFENRRRQLLGAVAGLGDAEVPQGFAGRVLMAAKTRPAEETPEIEEEVRAPFGRFVVGGAIAAVALGVFVVAASIDPSSSTTPGGVGVAGHAGLEEKLDRPHFVVRAPGVGAAKARSQAVSIIEAHGGRYEVSGAAIYARVPRAQLVGIMRDLSKRSRYKVEKSDAGELGPSLTEVVIKFELE